MLLPNEWFPLGISCVYHLLSHLIISNSPSLRFCVSPVGPQVPGIRASAQRNRSKPSRSRADGAQRPAVNGQGGRRGHGDHRDRDHLPLCQISALFGASAHIAWPQTRSDWIRISFKFVVILNQQCPRCMFFTDELWFYIVATPIWFPEPFVWTVEPTKEELSQKLNTATKSMAHMNRLLHETEATNAVLMEQITVRAWHVNQHTHLNLKKKLPLR